MAGEEGVRLLDDGARVEQLVVRDAGDGAAGDRAHGVAAAAEARQPRGVELLEDVGELGEAQVVELDVLPRRQLGLALAVLQRQAADRLELRRRQASGGELDPEHEGPDLRLVVVEAPPLEPDDVLLRHVRVARGDESGQLVEHPERALLPLEALDAVPLENELQRGGLGCRAAAGCRACHSARSSRSPSRSSRRVERCDRRLGRSRRGCHLPACRSGGRLAAGRRTWRAGAPVAAVSSGQIPRPLAMANASIRIATLLQLCK